MSRSTLPEGDFTSCERLPSGLITRCTYKCRSRPAPSGRIVGNSYLGDYFRVARQLGMTLRFAEVGSREGDFSAREQGTLWKIPRSRGCLSPVHLNAGSLG